MEDLQKKAQQVLKSVFGYDSFRPLQFEIIKNVLEKKDTLAIMPTGGGKSLCYQIPALLLDGITVVVSPLISLMQDQVSSLVENGIAAVFLNSTLAWNEYQNYVKEIQEGNVKLVYVSPEGLATKRIQSVLQESKKSVSCITIDEAHCISEWGHDFRPDYLEIAGIRALFPNASCLALTATATKQVRQDIIKNLNLKNPVIFVASFNRKNIFLEVKQKHRPSQQIIEFLEKHKDESGIIYCFSRKKVDEITEFLQKNGYSAQKYHAGLSDSERTKNQDSFIKDKVKIMVATLAFGMGINKPNVRFVIHHDMPKSLEEYYQEIGRAGRDGLDSQALLLFNMHDIHKIQFFFEESSDPEKAQILLQSMINYAKSRNCRRKILLSYFGEEYFPPEKDENCCDVCSKGPESLIDVTIPSQKLMSCIIRTKQRFGASYVIDVLLGSRQKRILENRHHTLSTWGIGKELSKEDWFELCEMLTETGFIEKQGEYNVLCLTKFGLNALTTRQKIELPVQFQVKRLLNAPSPKPLFVLHKKGAFQKTLNAEDSELYDRIKLWRTAKAEEENIPPYIIFGDKTIEELVQFKPQTEQELLSIFGIGQAKAERFGSQILRLIQ